MFGLAEIAADVKAAVAYLEALAPKVEALIASVAKLQSNPLIQLAEQSIEKASPAAAAAVASAQALLAAVATHVAAVQAALPPAPPAPPTAPAPVVPSSPPAQGS